MSNLNDVERLSIRLEDPSHVCGRRERRLAQDYFNNISFTLCLQDTPQQ